MKARVFGKRFCTYCGQTNMQYYSFIENGETHVMGECFTKGCNNVDWCDGKTEEDVKRQYGKHLVPSEIKFINLI